MKFINKNFPLVVVFFFLLAQNIINFQYFPVVQTRKQSGMAAVLQDDIAYCSYLFRLRFILVHRLSLASRYQTIFSIAPVV